MHLSGVTPDLHSPKKVKSQIPRLQLVGEILGSTHKRGWGQKWPKMMLCSLFSETAEFGAAPGLCKALAAAIAPGGLLSCTGLAKCGMLWPSSLCPRHFPFLGKVWGKKLCHPGASTCNSVREFQLEFGRIQINVLVCRVREVLTERSCTPHAQWRSKVIAVAEHSHWYQGALKPAAEPKKTLKNYQICHPFSLQR